MGTAGKDIGCPKISLTNHSVLYSYHKQSFKFNVYYLHEYDISDSFRCVFTQLLKQRYYIHLPSIRIISSFFTFSLTMLQNSIFFRTHGVLTEMEGDCGEEQLKQENQRQKSYRKPQVNSQDRHKSDGAIDNPRDLHSLKLNLKINGLCPKNVLHPK